MVAMALRVTARAATPQGSKELGPVQCSYRLTTALSEPHGRSVARDIPTSELDSKFAPSQGVTIVTVDYGRVHIPATDMRALASLEQSVGVPLEWGRMEAYKLAVEAGFFNEGGSLRYSLCPFLPTSEPGLDEEVTE